jgi:hypothetical protein
MAVRKKSGTGFSDEATPSVADREVEIPSTEEEIIAEEREILPVVIESIAMPEPLPEIVPQPMPEQKIPKVVQQQEPLVLTKKPVRRRNIPRLSRIQN